MNTKTYIIDTSVAVKWLAPENEANVDQAKSVLELALAQEIKLLAPDLIVYEISNALIKGKKAKPAKINDDLDYFLDLPITIISYSKKMLGLSAELADQYSLTAYDATFVALAKINNATLITANPKDQGKVKEVEVLSIADFALTAVN